jgi:hypothetical protein
MKQQTLGTMVTRIGVAIICMMLGTLLACAPPLVADPAANAKMVPHNGWTFFYPTAVVPTGDPLVVKISYAAYGVASHLGRFTEVGEYSLHFNAVGTPLFITDVIATRTAANGDSVYLADVTGVITLTGDPAHPLVLEGDFTYAGGTGRFAGVSAPLHWRALGNADGSALSQFGGTISTVGGSK